MPLFDIQCRLCNGIYVDAVLPMDHADIVVHHCTNCRKKRSFDVLAPLCAMQPDSMWAGTDTRFGYFTSKAQYNQLLKERNIESIDKKELDKVRKHAYNAKQDKFNKIKMKRDDFIAQELTNVEISPDGNTIKERNKYVRKRQ